MAQQQVNLSFLDDEPKPDVTVNLDWLADHEKNTADIVAHQAEKFGGGDRPAVQEPAVALSGEPTSLFNTSRAGLPSVNPRAIWEAGKTAASDLGQLVTTPIRALLHPRDTAEALGRIREQEETQAGHEWQQGDYPSAIRRGALNMAPFGPSVNAMIDESAVDPAKGLGHVAAAAVAPELTPENALSGAKTAMTKIGELAGSAADKIAGTTGGPGDLMMQAIKPYVRRTNFQTNLQRSMPHVVAAAEANSIPLDGLDGMMQAVPLAKQAVRAQFEATTGGRPVQVDLNPVADAMEDSISAKVKREDPAKVAAIKEQADKYRAIVPQAEAEELLKNTNAELESYYNKYPGARTAALNKNPDTALLDAQGKTLRTQLYDSMNPGDGGAVPRELQKDYGALMELEQEGFRRQNVMKRQAPTSLSQQMATWKSAGALAGGTAGAIAGGLTGGPVAGAAGAVLGDAAGAYAQTKMANWLRTRNSTDSLIARAFKDFNIKPPERPVNVGQQALPPASGAVEPQSATGSATPGSLSAQSQWQRPGSFQMPQTTNVQRDMATGQMRRMDELAMERYLQQERASGRLSLSAPAQPGEEPAIDVPYRIIPGYQARPANAPAGPFAAPASSLPASSEFSTSDIKGLQNAPYDIQRGLDGRLKVYKGATVDQNGKLPNDAGVLKVGDGDTDVSKDTWFHFNGTAGKATSVDKTPDRPLWLTNDKNFEKNEGYDGALAFQGKLKTKNTASIEDLHAVLKELDAKKGILPEKDGSPSMEKGSIGDTVFHKFGQDLISAPADALRLSVVRRALEAKGFDSLRYDEPGGNSLKDYPSVVIWDKSLLGENKVKVDQNGKLPNDAGVLKIGEDDSASDPGLKQLLMKATGVYQTDKLQSNKKYFMTDKGNLAEVKYNHPEVLDQIDKKFHKILDGMVPDDDPDNEEPEDIEPSFKDVGDALARNKLIRINDVNGGLAIHIAHIPSEEAIENLTKVLSSYKPKQVYWDFGKGGSEKAADDYSSEGSLNDFLTALYKKFPEKKKP